MSASTVERETTWTGEWHPVAERFPMLSEEEIRRLADSIAETGQVHACLMTPDGLGLDGRNRVAACKIAGAEPRWEITEADPVSVILAANVAHRHLSRSQQTMAVAIGMWERGLRVSDKNGTREWKRGSRPPIPDDLHTSVTNASWRTRLTECGVVLDWRPDLADDVLRGTVALGDAYEQAAAKKRRHEADQGKLGQLPEDLAALVENGVRDLDDALAEVTARKTVAEVDKLREADEAPDSFAERVERGSLTWVEAATLAAQWRDERGKAIGRDVARLQQVNSGWGSVCTVRRFPHRAYVKETLERLGEADREALSAILSQIKE